MSARIPVHSFYGRIENGRPVMDDPEGFQRLKNSLEGLPITIQLRERPKLDNITKCRGYFHGVVVPHIARAAGYEPTPQSHARVKAGLKDMFLTVAVPPGEPIQVRSTESLTVNEYCDFIFHSCQYCAETFHDPVPDPE